MLDGIVLGSVLVRVMEHGVENPVRESRGRYSLMNGVTHTDCCSRERKILDGVVEFGGGRMGISRFIWGHSMGDPCMSLNIDWEPLQLLEGRSHLQNMCIT